MTTLIQSQHIKGELVATPASERECALLEGIGAVRYHGQYHLTPARAAKYKLLNDAGWSAAQREGGSWWYSRSGSKLMRLSDAMRCIEAMRDALSAGAQQAPQK